MIFITFILFSLFINEATSWRVITKNKNTMEVKEVWIWESYEKRLKICVDFREMGHTNKNINLYYILECDDCQTSKKKYDAIIADTPERHGNCYEVPLKDKEIEMLEKGFKVCYATNKVHWNRKNKVNL